MRKEKENPNEVKIYIDTCILQGALSRKNKDDTIFLNKCKENRWKVYTSIHTLMELFDVARERAFLMKSVIKKWVDVNTFLRERRRMNLNKSELEEISDELNNFFIDNKFIELVDINEEVWNDVKKNCRKFKYPFL
jgi:predicted nucleic acid-binding protein